MRGLLTDSSAGVVSGARLSLISLETAEQRSTVSDAAGRHSFNLLKIGAYEVTAEANGFRKLTRQATVRSAEIAAVDLSLGLAARGECQFVA